jgi:Flp pilus assembly protein TadG
MSTNRESAFRERRNQYGQETGAIIVMTALFLVFLLAMVGLAFDIGQAYINKSQLQNVADASALAGASALDSTAAGIIEAEHRATDVDSFLDNRIAFNTQAVPIIQTEVTYSVSLNGPWMDRAGAELSAPAIRFVRTELLNRPSPVFFGKAIPERWPAKSH